MVWATTILISGKKKINYLKYTIKKKNTSRSFQFKFQGGVEHRDQTTLRRLKSSTRALKFIKGEIHL